MFKKAMFKKGQWSITEKTDDSASPHPRQGLYTRNFNGRNYRFYRSWRPSWRPLFAENSIASRCSAPWASGRGSAPRPHPYGARGALVRMGISRPPTPFFEILDPPLLLYVWKIDSQNFEVPKKRVGLPPFISFWATHRKKEGKNVPPPPPPPIVWGRIDAHADEYPPNLSLKKLSTQMALREKKFISFFGSWRDLWAGGG